MPKTASSELGSVVADGTTCQFFSLRTPLCLFSVQLPSTALIATTLQRWLDYAAVQALEQGKGP